MPQTAKQYLNTPSSLTAIVIHWIFQAWAKVFYSIPLKQGQRIISCEQEYSSNYVAMLQVDNDLYSITGNRIV